MRRILTMLFVSVFMLSLCPLHAQETETLVLIDTDMGKIKVKLFNDTPLHRDNFIRERKRTRVTMDYCSIGLSSNCMDTMEAISTRKTLPWTHIWATEIIDYTIPAEFVYPKYFHKRGNALCRTYPGSRRIPRRPHQRLNSIS